MVEFSTSKLGRLHSLIHKENQFFTFSDLS